MRLANIKNTKNCAFYKHWYDPINSAIEAQNTVARDGKVKSILGYLH